MNPTVGLASELFPLKPQPSLLQSPQNFILLLEHIQIEKIKIKKIKERGYEEAKAIHTSLSGVSLPSSAAEMYTRVYPVWCML